MDGWKNGLMMEGWVDILMGEWMDERMDGRAGSLHCWMDEYLFYVWMDGWID